MSVRQIVTLLSAVLLLLGAGCERGDNGSTMAEADEPGYRQGLQLVKQGRSQEALAAFLKVIARRGESAPESHLEAGLLYLEQVKDPLAAIYHFRKYLELEPNSRQAPLVKQQIEAALREFAKTLPAQPLESVRERDELTDQIGRLQRENEDLKAELAALRGAVTAPMVQTRAALQDTTAAGTGAPARSVPTPFIKIQAEPAQPVTAAAEDESPVTLAPEPQSSAIAAAGATRVPTAPTRPATTGRTHTVVKGDTLFSLAQKYYGDRSKWRDIYEANRDVMPTENSLRIGLEIKIP
ncbi:MAG TPA: LysM peptidoglycan-binding domain-containing protein [Opitutus sp.]|nr:LysM peptidoglycan-binding domain-containing protein [Opitutus sp.]